MNLWNSNQSPLMVLMHRACPGVMRDRHPRGDFEQSGTVNHCQKGVIFFWIGHQIIKSYVGKPGLCGQRVELTWAKRVAAGSSLSPLLLIKPGLQAEITRVIMLIVNSNFSTICSLFHLRGTISAVPNPCSIDLIHDRLTRKAILMDISV